MMQKLFRVAFNVRSTKEKPKNAAPPAQDTDDSGPVEMDTILPEDSRPPTLTDIYNHQVTGDYLIDRFGFIYDQRRKKRQKEAANGIGNAKRRKTQVEMLSNARNGIEASHNDELSENSLDIPPSLNTISRPDSPFSVDDGDDAKSISSNHWQDYLRIASFPTELLSHTPSPKFDLIVEAENVETPRQSKFSITERLVPASSLTPKTSASNIVSSPATMAQPSINGTLTPTEPVDTTTEPVKLLLDQLTDVHDTIQREKTMKWNEFLRKVRASRQREDSASASKDGRTNRNMAPEITLADGELIGVSGVGNKGKVGRAKWIEFRSLVLGGIPVTFRAKIWAECSGASVLRVPGYYDDLLNDGVDDPVIVTQIGMDINRTLTDNIFFRKGPGVAKLSEVLLAYARRNPEVGYCQGMNLIVGSLLLIMPTAEDAFWVLASLVERILPRHYYDHSLLASRADQQVLRRYVTAILPKLSAHLEDLGIELEALTFQWFLTVFTDCLSAEALFRVWDVVLCINDGSTFLFQVALALLKLNERQLLECTAPASIYSYINHQMTNHAISIDGLIQASEALKKVVRRAEVDERRDKAVNEEREASRHREERVQQRKKGRELEDVASIEGIANRIESGEVEGVVVRNSEALTGTVKGLVVRDPVPLED